MRLRGTLIARLTTATALAVATAGIGLVGAASPAQAAPTNCQLTKYPWITTPGEAYSNCFAGTGSFRTAAYCSPTPYGYGVWKYGSWLPAGTNKYSIARCDSSYPYLVDALIEKK